MRIKISLAFIYSFMGVVVQLKTKGKKCSSIRSVCRTAVIRFHPAIGKFLKFARRQNLFAQIAPAIAVVVLVPEVEVLLCDDRLAVKTEGDVLVEQLFAVGDLFKVVGNCCHSVQIQRQAASGVTSKVTTQSKTSLNIVQPGAVKLVLCGHWMHLHYMHQ